MLRILASVVLSVAVLTVAGGCAGRTKPQAVAPPKDYTKPLPEGRSALREVDTATLPPFRITPSERTALQAGIRHSQAFLAKSSAGQKFLPEMGVSREQVVKSLDALSKLLATASDEELDRAIRTRFRALMSVGCDDNGTVLFSGYYTPILPASYTKEGPYMYPIHKRPPQLVGGTVHEQAQWKRKDGTLMPSPTASELLSQNMLDGLELLWFADPFDAYNARVQGSAKVRLPDGKVIDVGYSGTTGHEYVAIGKLLVADGKIPADRLSAKAMRAYFDAHPDDLAVYAAKNPRYTFFTVTSGGPFGSLGQPVTDDVTVATNKQIFPPAAPMLVQATVIGADGRPQPYTALRLDQDTGGAMRAPGRADLYMGVGDQAGERASGQWHEGRMWYLILK